MKEQFRKIPETRAELRKNDMPACQYDIRSIGQVWGEDAAEELRFVCKKVRLDGGVSPSIWNVVLPEGIEGALNEHELFRCVGNLMIWWGLQEENPH